MRHKWLFVFAFAACFAMAGIAQAQDKPVNFSIGGGYTAPNAEVRDHLGDGYNFNIGLQFNVTPVVGIETLYSFNGLGEKRISIPVSGTPGGTPVPTDFFANMNMQYFAGNIVLQKPEGTVRPYGLVGMGVYYRPIQVTTPAVGYIPGYCDPWWYICYPGGFVPVDKIVGERSSTDFGMDFGGCRRRYPLPGGPRRRAYRCRRAARSRQGHERALVPVGLQLPDVQVGRRWWPLGCDP